MLPFKRNYLQHALAMSAWMTAYGVKAAQDPKTLDLEVEHGGKVVHFYPQFDIETPEGQCFVQNIGPSVVGFVGWFPYLPKAWPAAQSKLAFKAFARQMRLRTPAWSQNASDAKGLVLVKRNVSTFGEGQRGPFLMPAGQALAEPIAIDAGEYIEQFIVGQLVKAWYWRDQLAVVEVVDMPYVTGDGKKTVSRLYEDQCQQTGARPSAPLLKAQGFAEADVLDSGQQVLVDYQYLAKTNPALFKDFNCRDRIVGSALEAQLLHAGRLAWSSVPEEQRGIGAFISLDGVLDAQGRVWFLEMNCNPRLHPAAYAPMLDAIFPPG